MDSRLPAKWRRKSGGVRADAGSGAGVGAARDIVKVEVVEEKLSWDMPKITPRDDPPRIPTPVKVEEVLPKEPQPTDVIDVDAELGEEDMDLSSTRSNSVVPEAEDERKEGNVVKELDDFMNSLTVMLKEDPDAVRKKAAEDIGPFLSNTETSSASTKRQQNSAPPWNINTISASKTTVHDSKTYIDLTGVNDLLELPPVTTCLSWTSTVTSMPSTSDNQAYLSLLDSDDESPNPKTPFPRVKQEFEDVMEHKLFDLGEQESEVPAPDIRTVKALGTKQPSIGTSNLQRQHHKHGLLSPPASDPTPERERSRSVSVALISIVPAPVRQKLTAEYFVIKEEKLSRRLGLATPPPTATKPSKPKGVHIPLPSPPLSSTDVESPVMGRLTPLSPIHHVKSASLKRRAPESTCTIKIPSPAARAGMGLIQLDQPSSKGRKRRKIKSAAYVVDDSPGPESLGERPTGVPSVPAHAMPSGSTPHVTIKTEPDVVQSLSVPAALSPTKRSRGRPPKKKVISEATGSTIASPIKAAKPKQVKVSPVKRAQPDFSSTMELQYPPDEPPVKREVFEHTFTFTSDNQVHHTPATSGTGLRRSQRVPKPRIKKEIEEFTSVPQLPPRKPRPAKQAGTAATPMAAPSVPSAALPEPPTAQTRRKKPLSMKSSEQLPKVKLESIDPSLSSPEKVFIRISAEKIRQISLYPPVYEIE